MFFRGPIPFVVEPSAPPSSIAFRLAAICSRIEGLVFSCPSPLLGVASKEGLFLVVDVGGTGERRDEEEDALLRSGERREDVDAAGRRRDGVAFVTDDEGLIKGPTFDDDPVAVLSDTFGLNATGERREVVEAAGRRREGVTGGPDGFAVRPSATGIPSSTSEAAVLITFRPTGDPPSLGIASSPHVGRKVLGFIEVVGVAVTRVGIRDTTVLGVGTGSLLRCSVDAMVMLLAPTTRRSIVYRPLEGQYTFKHLPPYTGRTGLTSETIDSPPTMHCPTQVLMPL